MDRRAFLTGAAAVGLGTAAFQPAFAQSYPSNVIRIVVPFSASTPPDILARIIATALSDGEGWKVVVENKPGAVMTIGVMEVLKQPADGYTLLSVTAPIAAVPALVPNASFNFETDFAPLIQIGTGYNVLVVNPSGAGQFGGRADRRISRRIPASTHSRRAASVRPRICSASCSSSRPACRRRMCPMSNFRRRSRT